MIPFSKPYTPSDSIKYVQQALESSVQQGDGQFSKLVETEISRKYNGMPSYLTPSCTAALELSLMLLDIKPGDEVIIPSFTFTSVATAVTKFWGTPVFCDIDKNTGCIDTNKIGDLISSKTKAISWVNYGGLTPDTDQLKKLSQDHGIPLIEDAAHNFGLLGERQREVTGDFVTFSFHATKNIQCGEGGSLLLANASYLERAQIMREKGTDRIKFNQGFVSKYSWVDRGSSYLLAEVNAALLFAQIQAFSSIQLKRLSLIKVYQESLLKLEEYGWEILRGTEQASHLFALLAPTEAERNYFIDFLKQRNILAVIHYQDLASSIAGRRFSDRKSDCPISKDFSARIVRLPVFFDLSIQDQTRVIDTINSEYIRSIR